MKVLITGGAGYIGTHCIVELHRAGHTVEILDNFSNSSPAAVTRTETIIDRSIPVHPIDLRDRDGLDAVFSSGSFDAVVHLAGLKAVGESVAAPIEYYENNLGGSLALLGAMQRHGVLKVIVSSSATVYGTAPQLPLTEDAPVGIGIQNPYGQTKFMLEQIVADAAVADPSWQVAVLRYFNPVGAHPSGLIGEDPSGVPSNLVPYVAQVAAGRWDRLTIHGDDYPTADGTGVRDYVHVVDLAAGHVAALEHLAPGVRTYNLGTGSGVSVLEIVRMFEQASGRTIPYTVGPRRAGDVAASYTDPTKAREELGWQAMRTAAEACVDTWRWQSANPAGYPVDEGVGGTR